MDRCIELGIEARKKCSRLGDRAILLEAAKRYPAAYNLILLDRVFTNEPVALVLARGDDDFQLAVDQKLSQLIRSDAFRCLHSR